MKTCTKCQTEKPLTAFAKNGSKQSYRPECKVCRAAIQRAKRNGGVPTPPRKFGCASRSGSRVENRLLKRARDQRYRQGHKDEIRARNREFQRTHPELVSEYKRRRRARKIGARGDCTAAQLKARFDFYGNRCAYCRVNPAEAADHVIPLARGGTNFPANFRPSCTSCNTSKQDKNVVEWSGSKQFSLSVA